MLSGLQEPLGLAFARDGRVFVAEKGGHDPGVPASRGRGSPRLYADLGGRVFTNGDRGLFALALDPDFPARPFVYVLYTFDGPTAATQPLGRHRCARPVRRRLPGERDGCRASGPSGAERVLLAGWCQQYPSHGVGSLLVGPDGRLYASGGEGASYDRVDTGDARNVCDDPPGEGGALRAQDASTPGDPTGVSGGVVAVDPAPARGRLVAYGLRNPFRTAFRPHTRELWVGDVGSTRADELDVVDTAAGEPRNFGWPCYEARSELRSYDEAEVPLCERLYDEGGATAPAAVFERDSTVVAGDPCGHGRQALSGLAFYAAGAYPARYRGALFFSDFVRRCIWAVLPGEDGRPDPDRTELFRTGVASPVFLTAGPGGDLFYLDFAGGTVHRLSYTR